MGSIGVSSIVFACVFGGLLGMFIRALLPQHHLSAGTKDVVKLGMGIVATLSALVLGLLIASAKGSFDAQSAELTQMSAKVILLDRLLAHYGPETKETRDLLRSLVKRILNPMWSKGPGGSRFGAPSSGAEILLDKIQGLAPKDDRQRVLQARPNLSSWISDKCAGCSMRRQILRFPAVARRPGFLAYHHLHQFRLVLKPRKQEADRKSSPLAG
jgi:hypothetical protein